MIALDAASGKLIWKFDSGIHSAQPARGVAYWTDGKESRIFATVSNFLYAIDAATGSSNKRSSNPSNNRLCRFIRHSSNSSSHNQRN